MTPTPTLQRVQFLLSECQSSVMRCIEGLDDRPDYSSGSKVSSLSADHVQAFKNMHINLRHTTTSLALAFKPPITIPAACQQLDKFIMDLCHIPVCLMTAKSWVHDGILLQEWRLAILDLCQSSANFLQALSDTAFSKGNSSRSANLEDPYLHYTARIWECCDIVSATASGSEGEAVQKLWRQDSMVVKDAWSEFKESVAGMEVTSGGGTGIEEDEDEDDMGSFGNKTISEEEHKTVETIKPMLQLLQFLHSYIPRLIPALDFSRPNRGRFFVKTSHDFCTFYDDLVCALYPTHSYSGIDYAVDRISVLVSEMIWMVRQATPSADGEVILKQWEEKMIKEHVKWDERKMSMGVLLDSLD